MSKHSFVNILDSFVKESEKNKNEKKQIKINDVSLDDVSSEDDGRRKSSVSPEYISENI